MAMEGNRGRNLFLYFVCGRPLDNRDSRQSYRRHLSDDERIQQGLGFSLLLQQLLCPISTSRRKRIDWFDTPLLYGTAWSEIVLLHGANLNTKIHSNQYE
jgi:hypothetical protein